MDKIQVASDAQQLLVTKFSGVSRSKRAEVSQSFSGLRAFTGTLAMPWSRISEGTFPVCHWFNGNGSDRICSRGDCRCARASRENLRNVGSHVSVLVPGRSTCRVIEGVGSVSAR